MKIETCSFSGYKIYPGKGRTYVRIDSSKSQSYFLQRLNPRRLSWTVIYRQMHRKGITEQAAKKRTRRTNKVERAVVGMSFDDIRSRRTQKPEARAAQRQAAIAKSKEAKKADQAAKKAKRAANPNVKVSKQQARGFQPKAAANSR